MQVIARRSLLATVGVAAAATLATVVTVRKPGPRVVTLSPDTPPPVHLRGVAAALTPVAPPRPVGDFQFTDADGGRHSLRDYAGKGVVLNLWASWCAPCVAEMPSLARLARTAAAQGLVVLPVSTDHGGVAVVQHFFRTHGITDLPVLVDTSGGAIEALHARGLPTTLLIDAGGHERARLEGGADWAAPDALATIRRLIG